jgi:hypothetical protein
MPRPLALVLLTAGLVVAADPDPAQKAGLQQVGGFVGTWNGSGDGKPAGDKKQLWRQTATWGWRFGDRPALVLETKDAKGLAAGTLTYQPKDKTYTLKAKDADGAERTYTGKLDRGRLVLEGKDASTGDVRRLTFRTVAEGVRLIQTAELQPKGRGPFTKLYEVGATKEGEAFAGGGPKNECVVTGGTGTTPVSYLGQTYYVCCSGCRDEFNANPKKYVDEYLKSRKK